ncbi:MAG: rod shape-determining protein MreD [Candidatus Marinimicrobia bacterium]|nr:rod shape-determining protein MreD [Candidatus Neomarinimicrobiota bacterium]MBL7023108.1 rod shape-determining protein MreD [Candidatus Neomarinimicrobiota bacterium]MBL7109128.1 rod shape-determining protein MreD [Candidatus Neomarinimicrobiota bacterium]
MKTKLYLKFFGLLIVTAILQVIFPSISIKSILLKPDLFLLFLTYIALRYGRFSSVLFGFCLGFIQDITTQIELLGAFSFIKSITGYLLGSIFDYERIWSKQIRWLVIVGIYFVHFSIYYFIQLNGSLTTFLVGTMLVSIHATINLAFLFLMNKFIFNSKLV